MNARLVGTFFAACLFVSLCSPIAPVAAVSSQDGPFERTGGSVIADLDDSNASADRPFAEAGLDQTVPVGATVYLDAYGSRAAEGSLVGYEWQIERPDGTTTTPTCSRCELTEFRPSQTGQYNVTITVEDEAGRTASDTMYVTVLDQPTPNATLTGPEEMQLNETVQVDLDASAPVGELSAVEWYVDGSYREGRFLETKTLDDALEFSPDAVGRHTISAVVRNDNGTARRVRHEITVRETATFEVEITDAADTVEAGQYWAPTFEVTNTDSITDTQEISLNIQDGPSTVDSETITLDPGETRSFDDSIWDDPTLAWYTPESAEGPFTAFVRSETDIDTTSVEVLQPAYFDMEILDVEAITGDFDRAIIELRVTNTGDRTESGLPEYTFDPSEHLAWVPTTAGSISLDPGESRTINFSSEMYDPSDDTLYARTEDDRESQRISGGDNDGDDGGGDNSCGADNCITPTLSFSHDKSPVIGEYSSFSRVIVTDQPLGQTSQANWIRVSDSEHPYERAPDSMVADPQLDKVDFDISDGNLGGFVPEELGREIISLSDTINGLYYDTATVDIQRGDPNDGDGGDGGTDPGPK
jgi:hypothetical protein